MIQRVKEEKICELNVNICKIRNLILHILIDPFTSHERNVLIGREADEARLCYYGSERKQTKTRRYETKKDKEREKKKKKTEERKLTEDQFGNELSATPSTMPQTDMTAKMSSENIYVADFRSVLVVLLQADSVKTGFASNCSTYGVWILFPDVSIKCFRVFLIQVDKFRSRLLALKEGFLIYV